MQYTWEFKLDDIYRKLELQHSRITGKRKIYFDGKEVLKAYKFTYEFSYSFSIDNHYLTLIQSSATSYDLRIDNMSFNSIINILKKDNYGSKRKNSNSSGEKDVEEDEDKKKNRIVIQAKKDKKEDFFAVYEKDTNKKDFDEKGFDFDDENSHKNNDNKAKNDDFDFGFGN